MDPEQSNAIQIKYVYECMYYKVPRAHEVKNQRAIAKRTYITSNESQLTSSDQQHIYYINHHQERTQRFGFNIIITSFISVFQQSIGMIWTFFQKIYKIFL